MQIQSFNPRFLDGFYFFRPENCTGSQLGGPAAPQLRVGYPDQLQRMLAKEVNELYAAYRQFMPHNFGVSRIELFCDI